MGVGWDGQGVVGECGSHDFGVSFVFISGSGVISLKFRVTLKKLGTVVSGQKKKKKYCKKKAFGV